MLSFIVLVNFTASSYVLEVNQTEATIRVMAFGEFDTNFVVNIEATSMDQAEQSTVKLHAYHIC